MKRDDKIPEEAQSIRHHGLFIACTSNVLKPGTQTG